MIAMLRDPEATRRMGQRARDHAGQRFSVEPHVAAVEGLYARAVSGKEAAICRGD